MPNISQTGATGGPRKTPRRAPIATPGKRAPVRLPERGVTTEKTENPGREESAKQLTGIEIPKKSLDDHQVITPGSESPTIARAKQVEDQDKKPSTQILPEAIFENPEVMTNILAYFEPFEGKGLLEVSKKVQETVEKAAIMSTPANPVTLKAREDLLTGDTRITEKNFKEFTDLIDSNPESLKKLSCSPSILKQIIERYGVDKFSKNLTFNIHIDHEGEYGVLKEVFEPALEMGSHVRPGKKTKFQLEQIIEFTCKSYTKNTKELFSPFNQHCLKNINTLSIGTFNSSMNLPECYALHLNINNVIVQGEDTKVHLWNGNFPNLQTLELKSITSPEDKPPSSCYLLIEAFTDLKSIEIGKIDLPDIETSVKIDDIPKLETLKISKDSSPVDLDIEWFNAPKTLDVKPESAWFYCNVILPVKNLLSNLFKR